MAADGYSQSEFSEIVHPDDIFIAIMGLTGSGKSTFIQTCTGQSVAIGHDLDSCTTSVSMYSFKHRGRMVHLIDTPGFDDTYRPESQVLEEIAFWLTKAYGSSFLLNGIIYLQSIAAPKWTNSAGRGVAILKAMCGVENFPAIILSTTFWDTVVIPEGNRRQTQLERDEGMWGGLKALGSIVYPHSAGRTSALAMVGHFVNKDTKHILAIQLEMSDEEKGLSETSTGRAMGSIWGDDIRDFERKVGEFQEELRTESLESKVQLQDSIANMRRQIVSRRREITGLHQSRSQLHRRWETKIRQDMQIVQQMIAKTHNDIAELRQQGYGEGRASSFYASSLYSDPEKELRQRAKDLDRARAARMASYGMVVNVTSAAFGGISAVVAMLPVLAAAAPVFAACSIM